MIGTIKNLPINVEDVWNDNTIYRFDVPTLKVKPVCQQLNHVQSEYIEVPEILRESIGNMTVAAYVIFANGISFVVSILRGVNFTMVEYIRKRLKIVLANYI